jgi:hypothetical protein
MPDSQSTNGRPVSAFINAVLGKFADYFNDPLSGYTGPSDTCAAAIYSRVEQAAFLANRLYVDNEWDIQRRRGLDPTARTYATGWGA